MKREEIREGIRVILKRSVVEGLVSGFTADLLLKHLESGGVVIKVDRELPDCFYDSLIFPTTIEEAGEFLTDKGLTDREKSAVSGTIARLGWENCAKTLKEAGYVAVEPLIEK